MLVTVICTLGLIAGIALAVRELARTRAAGETVSRSAIAWAAVFALIQLFVIVWSAIGKVERDVLAPVFLSLAVAGCMWASVARRVIVPRIEHLKTPRKRKPIRPAVCGALAICLAGVFAFLGLEIPSNHNLLWMYPLCALLEWALITVPLLSLYFLVQRRGCLPAVLAAALNILGIAEYFIITYKSMPIQPGDLSALSTAAAVSGGYDYILNPFCLYGMAFTLVSLLVCEYSAIYRPKAERRGPGAAKRVGINLLLAVVCLGGVAAHVTLIDYYNTLWVQVYTWRPLESYYREGFLPCFISAAQTIKPPRPADYTVDDAKKLIKDYAADYDEVEGTGEARRAAEQQFNDEKPTVITIMNETFSDLSIYQNLHADYQGPQYFKSISNALKRGKLYVSAYGGGTANTEFEYLTGNSMAYLGSGVYPYTIYDLQGRENLAAQFKSLGYTTTAMHPNHKTNWNRENVYEDFGFDRFLGIEDFSGSEQLRGMVTDQATYNKILELLDQNSDPQFIFDVTMQNHSGYKTGLLPWAKLVDYAIDGVSDPEVNEYLSLIEESDRALEYFINRLSQLDRKVVLVFFGDHQPFFPDRYNKWFTGEDSAVHAERQWQTSYVIWANYDVAGNDQVSEQDDLSTNYLGSELMQLIGAPLSDYQKAHIVLRNSMPAINSTGYADGQLAWYLSSASVSAEDGASDSAVAAAAARADLAKMQYYMLFRDGKDVYAKRAQTAANETDPNLVPGTTQIK